MCIFRKFTVEKIFTNIDLMGRLFANGPGDLDSILGCVIRKTLKWSLMPPCSTLSNIRYVSRVNWSNPGKEECLPLHLSVEAIEKEAFGSPSTMLANFTYVYFQILFLYMCREEENLVFCFGALFNSTLNFTQSG